METNQIIIFSFVGAILPDVLRIIANRYNNKLPDYFKSKMFWLGLFFLICVGFLANFLLNPLSIKEAIAYAFAAPEIISKMFSRTEEAKSPDRGNGKFNLRAWWSH